MSFGRGNGRENENERGEKKRGVIWAKKEKKGLDLEFCFIQKIFVFFRKSMSDGKIWVWVTGKVD